MVVFALGMIGLYTTSSLYHSIPWSERWKQRMQRTDHSMIFVLIAASYTPVAVLTTDGWTTVALLVMAWGVTLVGVAQQVFFPLESGTFGIDLMTTLGWIGLIFLPWVATTAGWDSVVLLLAGGVLYTVGMVMLVTGGRGCGRGSSRITKRSMSSWSPRRCCTSPRCTAASLWWW